MKKIPVIEYFEELNEIVKHYIDHFVMPDSDIGDAVHLAYASYYGFDYLLTWNCVHLANANKHKHIRVINERLGLRSPEITKPMLLFEEGKDVYE